MAINKKRAKKIRRNKWKKNLRTNQKNSNKEQKASSSKPISDIKNSTIIRVLSSSSNADSNETISTNKNEENDCFEAGKSTYSKKSPGDTSKYKLEYPIILSNAANLKETQKDSSNNESKASPSELIPYKDNSELFRISTSSSGNVDNESISESENKGNNFFEVSKPTNSKISGDATSKDDPEFPTLMSSSSISTETFVNAIMYSLTDASNSSEINEDFALNFSDINSNDASTSSTFKSTNESFTETVTSESDIYMNVSARSIPDEEVVLNSPKTDRNDVSYPSTSNLCTTFIIEAVKISAVEDLNSKAVLTNDISRSLTEVKATDACESLIGDGTSCLALNNNSVSAEVTIKRLISDLNNEHITLHSSNSNSNVASTSSTFGFNNTSFAETDTNESDIYVNVSATSTPDERVALNFSNTDSNYVPFPFTSSSHNASVTEAVGNVSKTANISAAENLDSMAVATTDISASLTGNNENSSHTSVDWYSRALAQECWLWNRIANSFGELEAAFPQATDSSESLIIDRTDCLVTNGTNASEPVTAYSAEDFESGLVQTNDATDSEFLNQ